MYRSFTDRVLGGVCGGLPFNSWLARAMFVILSLATLGTFALVYLLLWWVVPQDSLVTPRRGGSGWLLLAVILTALVLAAYTAHRLGFTRLPSGADLYWPLLLLLVSIVFLLQQLPRRTQ